MHINIWAFLLLLKNVLSTQSHGQENRHEMKN